MSVLPTKEDPSSAFKNVPPRFKIRRLAIFGVLASAAAFLLLAPKSYLSLNINDYAPEHSMPGLCADTSPIPATAPHHNVWKNFDVEEAVAIREWLWAYTDSDGRGFNFTDGLAATDL
jgi:primary-amine oxidase